MSKYHLLSLLLLLVACNLGDGEGEDSYDEFLSQFTTLNAPAHISRPASVAELNLLSEKHRSFLLKDNTPYPDSLYAVGKWKGENGKWFFHMAYDTERGYEVALYAQDSARSAVHKDMQLAYANCERGSCHQQDAWIQDIDADGKNDVVLKYVRSSDQGIIRQEGLVPYLQGEDGAFLPQTKNKPDARLFMMEDVGIKRYEYKASSLLASGTKANISALYKDYLTDGAYLFAGDVFPTEVSFLFEKTNNEIIIDWDKQMQVERLAFGSSGGKWYVGQWLIDDATTLSELEKINEAPISFYGFDWRYAGQVTSWNEGNLEGEGVNIFLEQLSGDELAANLKGDVVLNSGQLPDGLDVEVGAIIMTK